MSSIRIERVNEFRGDSVVLMVMDSDGIRDMRAAFAHVIAGKEKRSALSSGSLRLFIEETNIAAHISFRETGEIYVQLPVTKAYEIIEKLDAIAAFVGPCHEYVDIDAPANTLVLSKDEY